MATSVDAFGENGVVSELVALKTETPDESDSQ